MPRSVLLITSPFRPNIGGVETHLDDLILEGVKRRINFRVVTYQPLVTPARGKFIEKGRGVIIYRIPWPRFNLFLRLEKFPLLEFLYLFPGLFIAGIIYLLFKGKDISTIHGQGLVAGSIGVFLGLIFDKRSLISTHSIYNFPESGFYNSFVQSIFNKTEHILTLSNQSKDEILKLGTPKDKVTTFTYWVDQDKFKPTDKQFTRTKVKFPKNELVCLFVGRLVEVKGVRELISSSKFLIKGIKIVIIGDGPLANEIQAMARKSKKIDFLVSGDHHFDVLLSNDVRVDDEGNIAYFEKIIRRGDVIWVIFDVAKFKGSSLPAIDIYIDKTGVLAKKKNSR